MLQNNTRTIITTGDGSKTIHLVDWNENYHSTHGAVQEAKHVFLKYGLSLFDKHKEVRIFEVGFGTGLNAVLTYEFGLSSDQTIIYDAIEAYPVTEEEIKLLGYEQLFESYESKEVYSKLHSVAWDQTMEITPKFSINKICENFEQYVFPNEQYDLVYFDAFGPRVQETMWSHFDKLYKALKPGGILVTYCAKGQVKRDLKAVGFILETLPGPPGKREMTRAIK